MSSFPRKLSVLSLLVLTIGDLSAQLSFQRTPPVITPATGPVFVNLADFTGDGIPDVVMVNSTAVSVYPGNGDGTFKAPVVTALTANLGGNPNGLALGDFNHDGKQDLVISVTGVFTTGPVLLLLGNGDGTFQIPLTIQSNCSFPTAGDFNGDGNLDLALSTGSSLVVLLGNGAGAFTPEPPIAVSSIGGIAVGDLNGDHKLDIALSSPSSDSISVYLGKGDGTFGSPTSITVGLSPGAIGIRDLNGDGDRDIVVADTGSFDVAVILGNGNGTFQRPTAFPVPSVYGDLGSLVIGDFNSDGIPDLAIVGYVLLGAGGGKFQPPITYPLIQGAASVVTGDLNGDHNLDLVIGSAGFPGGQPLVSILLGKGTGAFRGAPDFSVGTNPVSIAVADFNGDGKPDLVTANAGSNSLTVALGTGKGTFGTGTSVPLSFSPGLVLAGDFNRDGKVDVVVSCYGSCTAGGFAFLPGSGTGGFGSPVSSSNFMFPLVVGDFNGDGIPDLAGNYNYAISVQLGNGDGTFQTPIGVFSGFALSLAAGDFNGDGKLDLLVGLNTGMLAILLGNGDGTFTTDFVFSVSVSPSSALVADLNGDGKPDVVVAGSSFPAGVSIFLGNGDGTFEPERFYPSLLGVAGSGVAAGDFNRDGKVDLALISPNSVSILAGNGDGSFQAAEIFAVDANPSGIVKGFFSGDKKPDLALSNAGSNTVSVLINGTP